MDRPLFSRRSATPPPDHATRAHFCHLRAGKAPDAKEMVSWLRDQANRRQHPPITQAEADADMDGPHLLYRGSNAFRILAPQMNWHDFIAVDLAHTIANTVKDVRHLLFKNIAEKWPKRTIAEAAIGRHFGPKPATEEETKRSLFVLVFVGPGEMTKANVGRSAWSNSPPVPMPFSDVIF